MSRPDEEGVAARARAARVLAEVLEGRLTLPDALGRHTGPAADEAFVRELCFGTARHALRLDHEVRRHLRRPPRSRDMDVHALMLLGAYQLAFMDVPDHAAVHATVGAVRKLGKEWARGLVNAVLRKLSASALDVEDRSLPAPARWNHPQWWLDRLHRDWPDDWQDIVEAGNARPPMTLRCRDSREQVLAELAAAGIQGRPGSLSPWSIYLQRPVAVSELPGFDQGALSVQDEGAQLAALLLEPRAGDRILDACAAPGGKALHLAQLEPAAEVVALEVEPRRSGRIRENVDRAGVAMTVLTGDGRDPGSWWDGRPFQRILLDAPCSASGILRRQPDIRLLRRNKDVADLASLQAQLLASLWPLLTIGGRLLYCTCSVFAEENQDLIGAFLEARPDARTVSLDTGWGRDCGVGRQLLPTADRNDGFFFALLERTTGGS